jgi:two-component system, cell cycle sensor histidine kinase and response regulator CckA
MTEPIHVLIVEDLPTDAELAEREIRKVIEACRFMRVETREAYIAALDEFHPALIVSDFKLPRFDGLSALNIALERCPSAPFIMLTGSMNEDTAVNCMKAGAWDYVIKEHVKRLGPAVQGAIERQRQWAKRKQAERSILEHRANLTAVLESADFPIFAVDREFRYTSFNRAHANMMKALYGADIQLGASLADCQTVPEDWRATRQNLERALQGEAVFESAASGDEGHSSRHFEVAHHPVRTDTGDIIGVSVFARDITQRKRLEREREQLEQQLLVSQKMEAIGNLAGGIAHDFNNMLSVILSYTGLMLEDLPEGGPARESLLEVKKACGRAVTLTRQLLTFSRKQVVEPTTLDLNEVAAGVERMLLRLLREDIQYLQVLAPDLGMTLADPGQVEQVLMNLVVNARDAMPNGGTLTIETSNVQLDEEYATRHLEVIPGDYIQLLVRDTGHGMDEQTRTRIFEPFFTTKDKDKGTGLGLSTVYGIVKQSGGHIEVDSTPAQGTTFRVFLPRVYAAQAPRTRPPVSNRRRNGTETILVVDDDKTVLKVASIALEKAGYTVLSAQGRDEALRVAAQHKGEIHLLLTDVVMPHMSGKVLAEDLVKLRPATKVLYMSGYTGDALVRRDVIETEARFISKPFSAGELMGKVREVLDLGVTDFDNGHAPALDLEAEASAVCLDSAALQALPADITRRLLDAVVSARHDEMIELVEIIRMTDPQVADGLSHRVDNFEYEALREFLVR